MQHLKIPVRYLRNWTIPDIFLQSPEATISDFYHLKISRLSSIALSSSVDKISKIIPRLTGTCFPCAACGFSKNWSSCLYFGKW